jgi:very-short-patch-repair endonuclease
MKQADREGQFLRLWRTLNLGDAGEPIAQHKFHESRRWRFDFAWPAKMVAVEIHGGGFVHGGHNRGRGQMNDCEKTRAAHALGWIVMPVSSVELDERPAQVIKDIIDVLNLRAAK